MGRLLHFLFGGESLLSSSVDESPSTFPSSLLTRESKAWRLHLISNFDRGRRWWDTLDNMYREDMPHASRNEWGGFVGWGPTNVIVVGGEELFFFSTEALAKSPSTFPSSLLVDIAASSFTFLEDYFCFAHCLASLAAFSFSCRYSFERLSIKVENSVLIQAISDMSNLKAGPFVIKVLNWGLSEMSTHVNCRCLIMYKL
jgi:hypothetical protein